MGGSTTTAWDLALRAFPITLGGFRRSSCHYNLPLLDSQRNDCSALKGDIACSRKA